MPATTTVRIPEEVREQLHDLADQTGQSMQRVITDAVDLFRRRLLLLETNVAYLVLAETGDEGLAAELAQLEGSLSDGLEHDGQLADTAFTR